MSKKFSHRNFKSKEFQPLAIGLGRTALALNDLLISMSGLLCPILNIPNLHTGSIIWNSIKSDRDQISLIQGLAESQALGLNLPKKIRKEIIWLCERASGLLDVRNDLLHSPFVNSAGKLGPFHLGTHKRALKLDGKDVVAECTWFFKRATMLRDYAESLEMVLTRADSTLPKRPILPDRPNRKNQSPRERR